MKAHVCDSSIVRLSIAWFESQSHMGNDKRTKMALKTHTQLNIALPRPPFIKSGDCLLGSFSL
jgi:urease accessory protein UreE